MDEIVISIQKSQIGWNIKNLDECVQLLMEILQFHPYVVPSFQLFAPSWNFEEREEKQPQQQHVAT